LVDVLTNRNDAPKLCFPVGEDTTWNYTLKLLLRVCLSEESY